jgi:hypothetical protein
MHWIFIIALTKCMYVEYHLLIVKMHVESSKSEVLSKNLHVLCDVKLIFGFPFIRPMLKCVHALIKFAQSQDVYMILWSLSHWPNKNYINFIVILLPNMKILFLMVSI